MGGDRRLLPHESTFGTMPIQRAEYFIRQKSFGHVQRRNQKLWESEGGWTVFEEEDLRKWRLS